jgi:hypothetical protein
MSDTSEEPPTRRGAKYKYLLIQRCRHFGDWPPDFTHQDSLRKTVIEHEGKSVPLYLNFGVQTFDPPEYHKRPPSPPSSDQRKGTLLPDPRDRAGFWIGNKIVGIVGPTVSEFWFSYKNAGPGEVDFWAGIQCDSDLPVALIERECTPHLTSLVACANIYLDDFIAPVMPARLLRILDDGQRQLAASYSILAKEKPKNPEAVKKAYWDSPLGLCVIDDFLSSEALSEIREFCLQSTVWFSNHYSQGRLGAFFREGFNCPTLIDVANEFSRRVPNLIGDRHPLFQLWGFKYSPYQSNTHPHADFAAANLNFWVTPDEANLDKSSGGLIVYDVEAPPDWKHEDYNKNGQAITALLRSQRAKAIYIPYRANRAILFNSDLFHVTAPLRFRSEYESRRINITMLYGRRAEDQKRPARL